MLSQDLFKDELARLGHSFLEIVRHGWIIDALSSNFVLDFHRESFCFKNSCHQRFREGNQEPH
jgi:hypothetical protein